MQLKKEEGKIYILFTDAESIKDSEGLKVFDYLNRTDENIFCLRNHHAIVPAKLQKDSVVVFGANYGDDSVVVKIDEIHKVKRILPYSITARSYWGEFRRKHSIVQRLNKLALIERSYIVECTQIESRIDGMDECRTHKFSDRKSVV